MLYASSARRGGALRQLSSQRGGAVLQAKGFDKRTSKGIVSTFAGSKLGADKWTEMLQVPASPGVSV